MSRTSRAMFVLVSVLALGLGGCSCGNEEIRVSCEANSCSGHGTCSDTSGAPVCACAEGWSGARCESCAAGFHDESGACVRDTSCLETTCNSHGSCDDSSGVPVCTCETGWTGPACAACAAGLQDNDLDGTCAPDCASAALQCGHGACSDASGAAVCACDEGWSGSACDACAEGYLLWPPEVGTCVDDPCSPSPCTGPHATGCQQTGDAAYGCLCEAGWDGTDCGECAGGYHLEGSACVADVACLPTSCSGHGACADTSGVPVCTCDAGYAGAACGSCAAGYQDGDLDGVCRPSCATAALDCGSHGTCSDAAGTAACVCHPGYAGAACIECATGWQDHDADGTCAAGCALAALECGAHGSCADTSGTAVCACDPGYLGAACDACDAGWQDRDSDGVCRPDCSTAGLSCGTHGACADTSGTALCVCETGWTGASCEGCAAGWQDHDTDGTCLADCATAALACSGHGSCTDASGLAACDCAAGYAGESCDACAAGWQDRDGDGTCLADCATSALDCSGHGSCSDLSGTAGCACDAGYMGERCAVCASGYQDNDSDGVCLATCVAAGLGCGDHGRCSDAAGIAACLCEEGWAGVSCDVCAAGYHADASGCAIDLLCTPTSCNLHGTCDDATGVPVCACEQGYAGATCSGCANGYQDLDADGSCLPTCASSGLDCGPHGSCSDVSGAALCACQTGYSGATCSACAAGWQDRDGDGNCMADCTTEALACGAHGACSDLTGTARCACDAGYAGATCGSCASGYQDLDANGTCLPTCATAALSCGVHGDCTDASGTAACLCDPGYAGAACAGCASGYQDNDHDGSCVADCATSALACGAHGTCSDLSGSPACVCATGWAGASCNVCASGYQDNDHDGTCQPDCASSSLACGSHGSCSDASGSALCVCQTGYAGETCGSCAGGYQDNDTNGLCLPTCATAALGCSGHGTCSDASGTAACVCDPGYAGTACAGCATGYQDKDGDGACLPTCATAALTCSGHGTCTDTTGTAACVCATGYAGTSCESCASAYQDNDHDGTCLATCATAALACGAHGACADASGTAACVCDAGWAGATCSACASGYHLDAGACVADSSCTPTSCSGHGTCDDSSGSPVCTCEAAYLAPTCATCASGYQDKNGDGTCLPTCAASGLACGAHGSCSDASGTAACVCQTGYAGANCESCAAGYQDLDSNGTCLPTCATAALTCSGHGSCQDASGTAVCVCATGYAGASCESCATGYQDNDSNGVCLPTCATAALACGSHGTCSDASGTAACVCATGYAGASCSSCASGYQDNDGNGLCLPTCATAALACGSNGSCSDASGTAACVCAIGYTGASCSSCATGYQDNDGNGTCLPTCTASTCNGHGTCADGSGAAICTCSAGYNGTSCSSCATGYQDNDGNGTCLAACSASTCGGHGSCADTTGTAVCTCDAGYAGTGCSSCATGFQDNDGDGTCLAVCTATTCSGHGACADTSGTATCSCYAGYSGASCSACASGYQDNDGNGTCLTACTASTCSSHGTCSDAVGAAACACDAGYTGANCASCATGYQDNDSNGTCLPVCTAATCSGHGSCSDASGTATCTCSAGYTGMACNACATGYQDNDGNGTCLAACTAATCGGHGTCADATGTAVCTCDVGYTGSACAGCTTGYQDNDGNGTCLAACTATTCSGHGACLDTSGTAVCTCSAGYTGQTCNTCATGYQDNDGNGTCLAACTATTCSGHGSCADASGTTVCTCDAGYTGSACNSCATGYQDFDLNGTCLPACTATTCSGHGTCADATGTAVCTCSAGYAGATCSTCATNYQDNDGNGTCLAACTATTCGAHGTCSDATGTTVCTCETGWAGTSCSTCANGYQDKDANGTCLPACTATTCSGHGVCADATGTAVCSCNTGWAGETCSVCATGYVLDGSGQCTLSGDGSSCAAPALLNMANGYYAWASVTGASAGSGNDTSGSCGGANANERVYSFTLTRPMGVLFDIGGYDAVAYLRTNCNDPATELVCSDDYGLYNGSHDVSPWISGVLPAGTYLLFVDGFDVNGEGSYTLRYAMVCPAGEVSDGAGGCVDDPCDPDVCGADALCTVAADLTAECLCAEGFVTDPANPTSCVPVATAPAGDNCTTPSTAIPIPMGEGVINGTMTGATDNAEGSTATNCDSTTGVDRLYVFTAEANTFVDLKVARVGNTQYNPVIHVRKDTCNDVAAQVACATDASTAGTARVLTIVEPGTYYVWVDSGGNKTGDYTLTYRLRPDPCASAACPNNTVCFQNEESKDDFLTYWATSTCDCYAGQVKDGTGQSCIEDPEIAEWTILIYMNGDNNLSSAAWADLAELRAVGSISRPNPAGGDPIPVVNVVVLHDDIGDNNTRLEYIGGGEQQLGEFDMGDYNSLIWFGQAGTISFPARRYALVMWDHGDGWKSMPTEVSKDPIKAFSVDDTGSAGYPISIGQYGEYAYALGEIQRFMGRKFDLLGFDACLMGMWEVANTSVPYGEILVASEENEPGYGWKYDQVLTALSGNPTMSADALGIAIADSYYGAGAQSSTLSVTDLGSVRALDHRINGFAKVLRANSSYYTNINAKVLAAQGYNTTLPNTSKVHRDLRHFATLVAGDATLPALLRSHATGVASQVSSTVLYNRAQASGYANSYGLAIYLPPQALTPDTSYRDGGGVTWSWETAWDEFVFGF